MLVNRKNKGVTLIEVILALSIMVITLIGISKTIGASVISRKSMNETMDRIYTIDAVKKLIICNYTYEETKSAFKEKEVYLNLKDLNLASLEDIDIISNLTDKYDSYPVIKFFGTEGQGGTLKITIEYHYELGSYMISSFFKGDYEIIATRYIKGNYKTKYNI